MPKLETIPAQVSLIESPVPAFSHPTAWSALVPLFAASGCAALIYEIVWFQMLELVVGSTAVSLAVLLASFMGGMCLGSLLLPRFMPPRAHPVLFWACLELGIGLLGLLIYFGLPGLAKFYAAAVPSGLTGIFFRALLCGLCLLPPTILMGATLPAIARLPSAGQSGGFRLGLLYGANTLGAMAGALLVGFVILRSFNTAVATYLAAGINGAIAAAGLLMANRSGKSVIVEEAIAESRPARSPWPIFVTIALSGFCALGAEVVWTRLLSLLLGGTTYTFSIILAVFLCGLGLGSGAGALLARRIRAPGLALGAAQFLAAAAMGWAAYMLSSSLPYWPINPSLSKSPWFSFQLDLLRCLWAILPATCCWGASFPLALAAAVEPGADTQRLLGKLYAGNTLGAILGAIGCSVVLISRIGTQQTERMLIALSVLAGLVVIFNQARVRKEQSGTSQTRWSASAPGWAILVGFLVLGLCWMIPAVPWPLVAYGRYLPQKTELGKILYMGEGMNASVAVTELSSGVRNFHVSGKIEASTEQQDMRLQRMLAHIPALFHPDPRSVLVVGCGAGVTAGSFLIHPGIERVSLCEIEPLIPRAVARFFGEENYDVVQDPRVQIIYDDARHHILTSREKFDIITSDPIHPWVKGAASLYTKEYLELCKAHLKSGGLVTQWVPLYESNLETVKSEIATFFEVFPEGTIWSNEDTGAGYDLVLLGQVEPLEVDVETIQRRLNRADHSLVLQSLRDVGVRSAFSLAATYAGQARDLKPWLRSAQINRDRDLRLQYLAGLGLNSAESDFIYTELSSYRRFPEQIFVGENTWNDALRRALEQPKPAQPVKAGTGSRPSKNPGK